LGGQKFSGMKSGVTVSLVMLNNGLNVTSFFKASK